VGDRRAVGGIGGGGPEAEAGGRDEQGRAPEKKPCRIWIVVMDDVAVAVTGRTLRLPRDRIGRSILKHVSYDVLFDWSLQPMF
jgi:hypothetical protein